MYKKFIICVIGGSLLLLFLYASIIICIDPYLHYHAPWFGMQPVLSKERYQNPGAAAHLEYDSMLLGSSMSENFKVSQFDEAFECKTMKLSSEALRTGSLKWMFEIAYKDHDIKNVFLGMDMDPLLDTYGNYYFPIPEYLYDDNPFNDLEYLLNKEVFADVLQTVVKNKMQNVPSLDEAYNWSDGVIFSKEAALASVSWDMLTPGTTIDRSVYIENAKLNLTNILPYIEAHPETEFYIFYPPYSILWWNMHISQGDIDDIFNLVRYSTKEFLAYDNVKLYSFQDIESVICNLDNYKDYNHYSPMINEQIIAWLENDQYRLTKGNYLDRINTFETFVKSYNYQSFLDS